MRGGVLMAQPLIMIVGPEGDTLHSLVSAIRAMFIWRNVYVDNLDGTLDELVERCSKGVDIVVVMHAAKAGDERYDAPAILRHLELALPGVARILAIAGRRFGEGRSASWHGTILYELTDLSGGITAVFQRVIRQLPTIRAAAAGRGVA